VETVEQTDTTNRITFLADAVCKNLIVLEHEHAEILFSERVAKVWNSLPPGIVNFSSLAVFRNSLKKSALEYTLNINAFSVRVFLMC